MVYPALSTRHPAVGEELGRGGDADAPLVAQWRAGDARAFEALVRRHQAAVFRVALRLLGDREEAQDAAQDALLRLHRDGLAFRGDSRFSTFVYRVAVNAALNRLRSLRRRRSRERDGTFGVEAERVAPPDPEASAVSAQLWARVQAALLELPEPLRLALVLYDVEGLAVREVARVLRIPEGTVKSRLHRARARLRERLAPARPEPGGGSAP